MGQGSDAVGVAALFMYGFVGTAQTVRDGEVWLAIESTTTRFACPSCGVTAAVVCSCVILRSLVSRGCWSGRHAPVVAVRRCVSGCRGLRRHR